jgi:hypothetical protein
MKYIPLASIKPHCQFDHNNYFADRFVVFIPLFRLVMIAHYELSGLTPQPGNKISHSSIDRTAK